MYLIEKLPSMRIFEQSCRIEDMVVVMQGLGDGIVERVCIYEDERPPCRD